jgi:hypothetical protein
VKNKGFFTRAAYPLQIALLEEYRFEGEIKIMRYVFAKRSIPAFFLTTFLLSIVSIASAQTAPVGGFRRVPSEPFSGRITIEDRLKKSTVPSSLRSQTINVEPIVRQGWQAVRPILKQEAEKFLNERDIGGGVRTSRSNLTLAENGFLFFGTDGSGFTLRYVLPTNVLQTSLRIPGPSPASSDPRLQIVCDMELWVSVDRARYTITAQPVRVIFACRPPTGTNFTGKAVIAVNSLIATLGGPDFIAQGLAAINNKDYALNQPINVELSKYIGDKVSRETIIGVTRDNNAIDGMGKKVNRILLTIEDDDGGPVVN